MERPRSPFRAAVTSPGPSVDGPRPGPGAPVDVFVSHVEEDSGLALELAAALEAAGFSTWCYEHDSIPGPSYLLQTAQAIERSRAVVVVISPHALGSNQVTAEVVRAHEAVKPFLPVLVGISHVEFAARQPEWREAIGSATTIAVPAAGVGVIVPRIVSGLQALGIVPGAPGPVPVPRAEPVLPQERPAAPLPRRREARRPWLLVAVAVLVVVVAAAALLLLRGSGKPTSTGGSSPQPSTTGEPSTSPTTPVTQSPGGGGVADAATTPFQTSQGPARIAAATLLGRDCPPAGLPGDCKTAPSGSRFLVLDVKAWNQGDLIFNQALSMEAFGSYVAFQGTRASPVRTWLVEGSPSGFRVVYAYVPSGAAGKDVNLFWPDNQPLRFRPKA